MALATLRAPDDRSRIFSSPNWRSNGIATTTVENDFQFARAPPGSEIDIVRHWY